MQLLLDLPKVGHRVGNILPFSKLSKESNAYIHVPGCVLDYAITTDILTSQEKLFFLLVNTLSKVNYQSGNQRSIALSAESWAKRLNCAKSQVFAMQNSLEAKGYFIISRDRNKHGQNKRNLICPTLPDEVFKQLSQNAESRVGHEELYYFPRHESKLQFLDRTKLFIIVGYQLLKDIFSCEYLSAFNKLLWLDFYAICYKSHVNNFGSFSSINSLGFSFVTSYKQLEDRHSCDKRILSKALIDLEELGLIKRERFYTKKEQGDQERQDKSLWKISLVSSDSINSENTPEGTPEFGSGTFVFASKPIENSNIKGTSKPSFGRDNSIRVSSHISIGEKGNNVDKALSERAGEGKGREDTNYDYIDEVVAELANPGDLVQSQDLDACRKDKTPILSACIAPYDPEFPSTSLYYKKDIIINNFKSNIVKDVKLKKIDFEKTVNNSSTNNLTSNISCPETTKKLNQTGMCDDGGRITNIDGVFRRKNSKKEIIRKHLEFNVCNLLIKDKLKNISKDKADKARMFAYSIFSQKIAKGYAATLSKNELAKQLIFHAASWRPTKVGRGAPDDKLVDMALSVAWKVIVKGSWQQPLEWAKAKELHYEFLVYKKKFKESGIISHELRSLESMINNLLGDNYDLATIISQEVGINAEEADEKRELKEEERAIISEISKNGATTFEAIMNGPAQLNQDALHPLTLTERNYQKITNVIQNEAKHSLSYHSHNNQNENRAGQDHIFENNQCAKSISHLAYKPDSFRDNHFLVSSSKTMNLSSIPTMNSFSRDLSEHQLCFNLLKNNDDKCQGNSPSNNYQNYLTTLKFFEVNDKGELVIALHTDDQFIHSSFLAKEDNLVSHADNSISKLECGKYTKIIEGQENVLCASDKHLSKEFIKIDKALNGILKNLKRGN